MIKSYTNIILIISSVIGTLVQYNFKNSVGQVISDLSGNNNYAVLGATLLLDTSDPIPTDRGLYFTKSSHIALPPNILLVDKSISLSNFYVYIFIYVKSQGIILSFTESKRNIFYIKLENENKLLAYQNIDFEVSLESYYSTSNEYLDYWDVFVIKNSFIESQNCPISYFSIKTYLGESRENAAMLDASKIYNIILGNNATDSGFEGFISEFYMFEYNECFLGDIIYSTQYFPSDNSDPNTSNNGEVCDCLNYSCTGSPSKCIKCDSSCELYCTNSTSCLNIIEICKPYAIINGVCDTNSLYITNCKTQESGTVCLECESNYSLSQDNSGCCSDGFYLNENICTLCDDTCSTCKGSGSDNCIKCSDPNASSVNGTCICNYGYFMNKNNSVCEECHEECLSCTTGLKNGCTECSDPNSELSKSPGKCKCKQGFVNTGANFLICGNSTCNETDDSACLKCTDPNAISVNGTCACVSGYFKNERTGICEECHDDCLTCSTGLKNGCTDCRDKNSELLENPGECRCKKGFASINDYSLNCSSCYETCETCTGVQENQCTSCKDPYSSLNSSTCICNPGLYYNSSFICTSCHPDCLNCSNSTQDSCFYCQDPNAFIYSTPGKCECVPGYFQSSIDPISCESCHETCATCSGSNASDCLTCEDINSYIHEGYCKCFSGYYWNETFTKCEICKDNCNACDGSIQCDSCSVSCEVCEDSKCLACKEGFYLSPELKCDFCHPNCKTCDSGSEYGCLKCFDEKIKIKDPPDKCLCNEGEYIGNTDPLTCLSCGYGCYNCNGLICFQCLQGFSLVDGECIRNELELDIKVLINNTIIFNFTEPLMKDLQSDQFISKIEGDATSHSIEKKSETIYEVNIDISNYKVLQIELIIIFEENIQGQSNSILKQLIYNCTLINSEEPPYKISALLSSITKVVKASIIVAGIASMFLSTSNGSFWVTFNTIQTISYIPLFNIEIPDFLKFFLIGVRPIEILPNLLAYYEVFTCDTPEIPVQFYSYGFTCKNFLLNCGGILFVFIAGIIILLLLLITYSLNCKIFRALIYQKLRCYKYAFFIRFWIHSYVELMLAVLISLNFLSTKNIENTINSLFGFFMAIFLFVSPFHLIFFYATNREKIKYQDEDFIKKYSPLIEDFNLDSKFQIFLPMFFFSKFFFVFSLYYCINYPSAQLSIALFTQILNILFMIKFKVYKLAPTYRMFIFQELTVLIAIILLSLFLFGFDNKTSTTISYGIIAVSGLGTIAGIFSSFFKIIKVIRNYIINKFFRKAPTVIMIGPENCEIEENNLKEPKIEGNSIQIVPFNSFMVSPYSSFVEDKKF